MWDERTDTLVGFPRADSANDSACHLGLGSVAITSAERSSGRTAFRGRPAVRTRHASAGFALGAGIVSLTAVCQSSGLSGWLQQLSTSPHIPLFGSFCDAALGIRLRPAEQSAIKHPSKTRSGIQSAQSAAQTANGSGFPLERVIGTHRNLPCVNLCSAE